MPPRAVLIRIAPPVAMGAFLMALRVRGETVDELNESRAPPIAAKARIGTVGGTPRICGSVISPCSPPGIPYIGGISKPWRIGSRPVMIEARVGVHEGSL